MIKTQFTSKEEYNSYIAEQKERMEKGYLTRSEREALKKVMENEPNIVPVEETKEKKGKPIIKDIRALRKPSHNVEEKENISSLIKDLKTTLSESTGYGLSAIQIGVNKRVFVLRVPVFKDKKIEVKEYTVINPEITAKINKYRNKNEGCISFPGIFVDTIRYKEIDVRYTNEEGNTIEETLSDMEGLAFQHEYSHCNGRTIFDDKWKSL